MEKSIKKSVFFLLIISGISSVNLLAQFRYTPQYRPDLSKYSHIVINKSNRVVEVAADTEGPPGRAFILNPKRSVKLRTKGRCLKAFKIRIFNEPRQEWFKSFKIKTTQGCDGYYLVIGQTKGGTLAFQAIPKPLIKNPGKLYE